MTMTDDLKTLQGTWTVTSLTMDGERMDADAVSGAQIVVKGRAFTSLGKGGEYGGTIDLDQKKSPKRFDLLITAGHAAGTRHLGIYRLDGDTWSMCLATRGDTRPRTFSARPGTGFALETLVRGSLRLGSGQAAKP